MVRFSGFGGDLIFSRLLEKWYTLNELGIRISLSRLDSNASSKRVMHLEKLYDKISLNFSSMIRLVDGVPQNEIDIAMLASAARNIIESTNLFFYFSDASDKDMFEFKDIIFWLNDKRNTTDIFGKLGIEYLGTKNRLYQFEYEAQIQQLRSNPYFQALSTQDQSHVLLGRKHTYKLEKSNIISGKLESAFYNLFSNSIHSLYGGLSSNSQNASSYNSGIEPLLLYVFSFEAGGLYYANTIQEYLRRRYRLRAHFNTDEKDHIAFCANTKALYGWIDYFKMKIGREY